MWKCWGCSPEKSFTPLKETNLGLAQALFDLQKVHFKMDSKSGVVKNQHISAS